MDLHINDQRTQIVSFFPTQAGMVVREIICWISCAKSSRVLRVKEMNDVIAGLHSDLEGVLREGRFLPVLI